jgi:hypothetical protein
MQNPFYTPEEVALAIVANQINENLVLGKRTFTVELVLAGAIAGALDAKGWVVRPTARTDSTITILISTPAELRTEAEAAVKAQAEAAVKAQAEAASSVEDLAVLDAERRSTQQDQ